MSLTIRHLTLGSSSRVSELTGYDTCGRYPLRAIALKRSPFP